MKISNNNVTLRDFDSSDIETKVKIINDSKNNKYLHYDLPLEYEKTFNWYNKIKNNKDRLDLSILYNNEVVGFIGLLDINQISKKAEYYICVDSEYTGKGIGTIASNLLVNYAFNELDLQKVYLYTEENNIKAQHLFEKVGFQKEGLLKNDIIYNNEKRNRFVYGLIKEEVNG